MNNQTACYISEIQLAVFDFATVTDGNMFLAATAMFQYINTSNEH